MAFQVILKRTNDPEALDRISAEVASISGAPAEQVRKALETKSISIGKDFSQEKAQEITQRFEALGAKTSMKDLSAAGTAQSGEDASRPAVKDTPAVAERASSPEAPTSATDPLYDDEEEEEEGVLLTKEEFVKAMNERSDIFYSEKEKRLKVVFPLILLLFFWIGFFFRNYTFVGLMDDMFTEREEVRTVELGETVVLEEEEEEEEKQEKIEEEKQTLKPDEPDDTPTPQTGGGGGDPRERVMKKGVLGRLSGPISANTAANADPLAQGGHAEGVDALLAGSQGIKQGGGQGAGRATSSGIGFGGTGSGSGFGGGSGELNLDRLSGSQRAQSTQIQRSAPREVSQPDRASHSGLEGGRSRANIMRTVRNNMASLQYAYNRHLNSNPNAEGKITIEWAIDEHGHVLHASVTNSTMNDPEFESIVVERIKSWNFGPIDIPGDVTSVTYPFVFTQ
jgi:TonB family protein